MRKLIAYTSSLPEMRLEIEEDENVGFYLIVYPHDSDQSQADHLQDTLAFALDEAQEKYGVSPDKWSEQTEEERGV